MAYIKVAVNRLRKGMIVGEDVYTKTGVILVTKGSPVTKEVVNLLTRHFIDGISVEYQTDTSESVIPKANINEEQYNEFKEEFMVAENKLSDNLKNIVYKSSDINVSALMEVTNNILNKSKNENDLCNMLLKMKEHTESIYAHSINVSIFCQILARWTNCTEQEIEDVAVAGLLHDIGALKFSKDILDNYSFRKEIEGGVYDKHVINGYNLIKNQDIDDDIKKAVLTHHEKLDGSGFPLRVGQAGICKIARILAIADIYDTYTMKEEGESIIPVFNVLKMLEQMHLNRKLDSQYTMTFISRVAETLVGYEVELNNGHVGKVVMINKYDISKPLVQVGEMFIDLSRNSDVYVTKIFK